MTDNLDDNKHYLDLVTDRSIYIDEVSGVLKRALGNHDQAAADLLLEALDGLGKIWVDAQKEAMRSVTFK